jgi:O-antigen/teichoic acid export membrane protein
VLFPAYCRARSREEAMTRTYLASVSAVLLLVAPAALVVAVIPDTVVNGLLGAQWALSVPLLVPLALAAPFHAAMGMAGPLLWGQDAVGRELRMQIRVAALAAGALLVASRYSVSVVAWAVAGIYVVRCVLVTAALMSRQRLPVWSLARIAGPPFMLAATIAAAVFLLDQLMSEHGIAAPARLLTDATTGAGAWILLLLCMPGAFIAPSLRVFLSRLERHFPTRLRPFLQQITASA